MRSCPVCDFRNINTAQRCLKCNALLVDDEALVKASMKQADQARESDLALVTRGSLERLRRWNPVRKLWGLPEVDLSHRFPFTAGICSIVPGGGQLYNHQTGKAILLAGLWWLLALVCVWTFFEPYSNAILIALLIFYLFIWNDAISTAIRINGQHWGWRNTLAMLFGLMFFAGFIFTGIQYAFPALVVMLLLAWAAAMKSNRWLDTTHWSARSAGVMAVGGILLAVVIFMASGLGASNVYQVVRITKSSSWPEVHSGDIIAVNNFSYVFGDPKLGELAYFDPPRFALESPQTKNIYGINIRNYMQRVCGMPGDKLEVRGKKLYRNGHLAPPEHQPIGVEEMPEWKFAVPDDHYFIPVTHIPDDTIVGAVRGVGGLRLLGGFVLHKYDEAVMVPREAILGRVSAILNPPERRRKF